MNSLDYVREIRKNIRFLIVVNSVVLLTSVIYYHIEYSNLVESSISFYLGGLNGTSAEDAALLANGNRKSWGGQKERMLSFGNSVYVKERVIDQFDLRSHGGNVDTSNTLNSALNLVSKKYRITINGREEMVITVRDTDMKRAYEMSNQIMLLTNKMNNDYLLKLNARKKKLCEIQLRTLAVEKINLFAKMDSLKLSYANHIELNEVMFSLDNVLNQISEGKFQGKESIRNYSKLMRLHARIEKINDKVTSIDTEILKYEKMLRKTVVTAQLIPENAPIIIESIIPSKDYSQISTYIKWPLLAVLISLAITVLPLLLRVRYRPHIQVLLSKNG
ncbi:MAG: hypothetical protein JKY18_02755 [Flavobacteriales bacterium]|nr:hypothetical protein [Flavobacteriales bacterium]